MNEYDIVEYLEKYFGEKITKDYVNKTAKELSFLPPAAIKYISDPKLKQLYELYVKLFENWEYGPNTNINDEILANVSTMPIQEVSPIPISEKQWLKLSTPERKTIINLAEKFNKNRKYDVMLYALPFIIKDKGQKYVLVPKEVGDYTSWVMINDQGKIIKDNIPGDYMLGTVFLSSGGPDEDDNFNRIYNINDLKAND